MLMNAIKHLWNVVYYLLQSHYIINVHGDNCEYALFRCPRMIQRQTLFFRVN